MSDSWRRPPRETIARAAGVLAAVVSAALVARTAVPYSAALIAAVLPRLLAASRAWLAPPYLFATVHVIILIIWKLSEHKKHGDDDEKPPPEDKLADQPSPEILRSTSPSYGGGDPGPISVPVPYSVESSSSSSTDSSRVELEKTVTTTAVEAALPPVEEDDDSMEARWMAIVQGGAAPVVVKFTPGESGGGEPNDDWDERFDAFIRKNYEQIRFEEAAGVTARTQ